MEMTELNEQWKRLINEQRLYIIIEEGEIAVDFLLHLTFSNPRRKVLDGFESLKIDALYTGDIETIKKEKFDISVCGYVDNGQTYDFPWEINSNREEMHPSHGMGFFFGEYFNFLNMNHSTVEEMLDLFDMEKKICEAVALNAR